GTPTYMAPEQSDGLPADIRSDLFSLGCVLYEAACGRKTFEGTSVISILKATALQEPRPLHDMVGIPYSLSNLIMRLLAKDPDQRPQSATEVIRALEACMHSSEAPPSARISTRARAIRPSRRWYRWLGTKYGLLT